jgi:hypothetical protein
MPGRNAGAARGADLVEVVTIVRDDGTELAIHAMRMRPKYRGCSRVAEMPKSSHGKTASGKRITDEMVAKLAEKAEAGLRRR